MVLLAGNHFGGGVAGGATGGFKELAGFVGVGESEVDDFDCFVVI